MVAAVASDEAKTDAVVILSETHLLVSTPPGITFSDAATAR